MPSYLYVCDTHGEFEIEHSIRDDAKLTECHMCRAEKNEFSPVKRLINGGGSGKGIVELTGQEFKDSVLKDAQRIKSEAYSSEKKYANIIGDSKYEAIQQRMDKQRR